MKPLDAEIDLPTGRGLVLVQVPRLGWTVLQVTTQGSRVLESKVLYGPESHAACAEQMKLALLRNILAR